MQLGAPKRRIASPGMLAWFLVFTSWSVAQTANSTPPQFTFSELVTLSRQAEPPENLQKKLDEVLRTAAIDNSASKQSVRPFRPAGKRGEPLLRTVFWNIERGQNFELILLAFTDPRAFEKICSQSRKIDQTRLNLIRKEAEILGRSDLILLNEVDLGVKRSDYRDVSRELAQALHMNYAFAVEFVEVDPLMLGIQRLDLKGKDQAEVERLQTEIQVDPHRYKGLHGSAVLTRYPIQNARIFRLPVCHDWYHDEMGTVPAIEKLKRSGSEKIFLEEISQERRRGGRMAMIIDLAVPDTPSGTVTIVNTHLENKCKAACRQEQIANVLEHVQDVTNPLILAGDMNTSGSDGSILSTSYLLKEKLKDYHFWGRQLIGVFNPITLFGADTVARYYRKYQDPTVSHIPILADNHERGLFDKLRKFRFDDQGALDFRGDRMKTVNGKAGTLANSNQRAGKGFTYTFSLPRDFKGLAGRFRLDWFFIKPAQPANDGQVMAPEFARTMQSLNEGPSERISDHAPITVDLPLTAGTATEAARRQALR